MRILQILTAVIISSTAAFLPLSVGAETQGTKVEIAGADDIKAVLNKIGNKPVTLILDSQKEVSGKINSVTDELVHVTELSGKEFYDAVVKIDSIESVIVRAR